MTALARLPWLSLSALLTALLLLGTIVLGWDRSFWFDEVYSLGAAAIGRPLDWTLLKTDVHPPGYNLLVRTLGEVFPGDSPGLRAANLLGLAAALTGVALLRAPLGRDRTLLFFCMLLCSGYALQLSLDLRAYALLLGLTTLAHVLLLRQILLGRRSDIIALILLAAALASLHFFGSAIGLTLLGLSLLWHLRNGAPGLAAGLALAIVVIAGGVLTWALVLTETGGKFAGGGNWIDLSLGTALDFAAEQLPLAILGLMLLVFRQSPPVSPDHRHAAAWMLAGPVIVVAVTGALSLVAPLLSTRNLTVCIPGLALAAVLIAPQALVDWLKRTPLLAAIILFSGLRYADTGIRNFQMIEWAIETATPAACDGATLYTLDPGNVSRFSQEVFLGEVKRPMEDMRILGSAAPAPLPAGCDIIAVGWHQDGKVDEVTGFFSAIAIETEAILPPDAHLAENALMTSGYVIRLR